MNQQRRRGGGFVRGFVVLGVLALVAAGVAAYLLRDQGSPEGADGSTAAPANLMATGGVEKSISDRLTARTGRAVVAECPEKVDALVGTTFTCEARYEGDDAVRSVVNVKITGGGGQFQWNAEQAPDDAASSG